MKKILALCYFLLLSGFAAYAEAGSLYDFHQSYARLLDKHTQESIKRKGVSFTAVDYAAWSQDPLHSQAMDELRAIDPTALNAEHRMAYWINAYNLLTIDLIISAQEKESIRNLDGLILSVFRKHSWPLFDRDYTLHYIEHNILRPTGESRIHFAINCASLSCPDLRTTPFSGEKLAEQLHEQTAAFIENPTKGFAISGEDVSLSALFKWYTRDFGGKKGVADFIKKWTDIDIREAKKVRFMRYDWSLNGEW